jgi:PhnB protein
MHVALPIGANMLMGSDVPGNMPQAETGTNISLSFHAESREDADRIFAGLAEGALHLCQWQICFGATTGAWCRMLMASTG